MRRSKTVNFESKFFDACIVSLQLQSSNSLTMHSKSVQSVYAPFPDLPRTRLRLTDDTDGSIMATKALWRALPYDIILLIHDHIWESRALILLYKLKCHYLTIQRLVETISDDGLLWVLKQKTPILTPEQLKLWIRAACKLGEAQKIWMLASRLAMDNPDLLRKALNGTCIANAINSDNPSAVKWLLTHAPKKKYLVQQAIQTTLQTMTHWFKSSTLTFDKRYPIDFHHDSQMAKTVLDAAMPYLFPAADVRAEKYAHLAVMAGDFPKLRHFIEDRRVCPDAFSAIGNVTLIKRAIILQREGIATYLLTHDATVQESDRHHVFAAKWNMINVVRLSRENPVVDVNGFAKLGYWEGTPIDAATEAGNHEVVVILRGELMRRAETEGIVEVLSDSGKRGKR